MKNKIYPIINLKPNEVVDRDFLSKLLDLNPVYLQLRIKNGLDSDFLKNIEIIQAEIEKKALNSQLIINDNIDIAIKSKINFVHIGQEDFEDNKNIFNSDLKIGFSTHSLEQIEFANNFPFEYIGFGPVFKTKTKNTGYNSVFDLIEKAVLISKHKIVFIGGIKKDNFLKLPLNEKTFFAVISGLKDFI